MLVLLLLVSVSDLRHQWLSGELRGASGLTAVHEVLEVCFYVLLVTLLLVRRPSQAASGSRRASWAAYIGTFTPFLLLLTGDPVATGAPLTAVSVVLMTLGLAFSVYSLAYLGRSFGVVPKARKLVRSGPYRFVRHPLYVGEFITFAGVVIAVLNPYTALVFAFSVLVQTYRAAQEERVLKEAFPEYESYMTQAGRFTPRVTTSVRAPRPPRSRTPIAAARGARRGTA
ncbi:methyltransferase family protein [Nocardioides sp. MAHUQ-72]|uniref:methyltransferase family protein n=1 Tax=unclassified Nocardioides TaxID=2615069 RepID=UPI00360BA591